MSTKLGVGVVGAGAIFPSHLQAYKFLSSRFRLIGIADTDEMRLREAGQKHFLPVSTTNYNELLERDDVDIIDICTPPGVHTQIVKDAGGSVVGSRALFGGKPVSGSLRHAGADASPSPSPPNRNGRVSFDRSASASTDASSRARSPPE